jgi:predicted GNAT superfamily acetyltransferase
MIEYQEIEGRLDPPTLEKIEAFYKSVFNVFLAEEFALRMNSSEKLLTLLAFSGEKIVGFKIGYGLEPDKFYSWIGGVQSAFRGQGIAAELMRRQHEWCSRNGFRIIQTKTKNSFKPMLILNIKSGFDIVEAYRDEKGEVKIVLEKRLDQKS